MLLQRFTFGRQPDADVLVSLVGFTLMCIGIRPEILKHLLYRCSHIGQSLFGIAPSTIAMRLGVSDHLLCRGSRIGHSLHGFPPSTVGMGPGVSDYLLCRGSGTRANVVSLVLSSSDMFIGGSLGQSQHLKGLTLGVWSRTSWSRDVPPSSPLTRPFIRLSVTGRPPY